MAISSVTSSSQVAMMPPHSRPTADSIARRCGGLVSAAPW
jgi:hypothetical protein